MGMATMLQSREPRRGSSLIVVFASGLALADAPLGLRLGQGRLSEPFLFSSGFDTPAVYDATWPQDSFLAFARQSPWGYWPDRLFEPHRACNRPCEPHRACNLSWVLLCFTRWDADALLFKIVKKKQRVNC